MSENRYIDNATKLIQRVKLSKINNVNEIDKKIKLNTETDKFNILIDIPSNEEEKDFIIKLIQNKNVNIFTEITDTNNFNKLDFKKIKPICIDTLSNIVNKIDMYIYFNSYIKKRFFDAFGITMMKHKDSLTISTLYQNLIKDEAGRKAVLDLIKVDKSTFKYLGEKDIFSMLYKNILSKEEIDVLFSNNLTGYKLSLILINLCISNVKFYKKLILLRLKIMQYKGIPKRENIEIKTLNNFRCILEQ